MLEHEQILKEVQNTLLPISKPAYAPYAQQELEYWRPVLKWLYEEAMSYPSWDCHPPRPKILDVGCAYGTLSCVAKTMFDEEHPEIHSWDVIPIIEPEVVVKYGLNFNLCDIETYNVQHVPEMDYIIFTEIIEHLFYNPVPTLKKLNDILRFDGKLLLSTPDEAEWGRVEDMYMHVGEMPDPSTGTKPPFNTIDRHIYQYSKGEMERIIDDAGFKVLDFEYSYKQHGARHLCYLLEPKYEYKKGKI